MRGIELKQLFVTLLVAYLFHLLLIFIVNSDAFGQLLVVTNVGELVLSLLFVPILTTIFVALGLVGFVDFCEGDVCLVESLVLWAVLLLFHVGVLMGSFRVVSWLRKRVWDGKMLR